ncbi:putative polyketide synthase [Mycena alexandri]|uniref:Polyketide synthase n=1 Tax=Mycena alexandri TaxID=1745969 RepID=A0AAD6S820_9AGAR|nr:putative polyketide synthase [Mycena alexandri]
MTKDAVHWREVFEAKELPVLVHRIYTETGLGDTTPTAFTMDIPIFAGQGTSGTSAARVQALQDALSPSGATLLTAFHEIFHAELASLSPPQLSVVGIDLEDFKSKESLLDLPGANRYQNNPVLSGTTLFLVQSLRYLRFIERDGAERTLTPFSDVLKRTHAILGFSSGILLACVVASSQNLFSYIANAVQALRFAIWIGVRTQIFRVSTLHAAAHAIDDDLPWGLVILGLSKNEAESLLQGFQTASSPSTSLYITAVIDNACVTVSGRPDLLAEFSRTLGPGCFLHKTSLNTLYHSPLHTNGAREEVIADVARRGIRFPEFADLNVPILSTFSGDFLTSRITRGSLVEVVIDMILTQPVNWDLVVAKIIQSVPDPSSVRLLNFGPGTGLLKTLERAFPQGRVSDIDVTRGTRPVDSGHVRAKHEPIAIVGMAVNLPGAPNTTKLWEVLQNGINTVSEIPEHRFKVEDYNGAKHPKRQMKAHSGNFLENVDEFDNKFFNISPREAKSMDPQQRVLLHAAYEALEDSGYVPNATPTSRPEMFGCYMGVATGDYVQNLRDEIDVYYSTGTLRAFLSGRISFAMQLSGPSIVVDTACSSSNVALYQGARALINGDCDAALVGGVNIVSSPDMFLGLDRGHFLSPTSQCKAFDASADGYSRSEGCGVFILKRLGDAMAENDNILGVIRGVEINQSGLAHSITYPHAATQAALFRKVLENSRIEPSRVNVVEAHGTGTQAGDPNEVESVRSVLAVNRAANNPLHITSVKANIGHLEAASGAAGLAKLLLMLRHRLIPRQISFKTLNPLITPLEHDNTVIDKTHAPWLPSHEGETRIALLNNFGAAGSNTALLLEEHIKPSAHEIPDDMSFVFGLSAKTIPALEELSAIYIDWLRSSASTDVPLSDIAYTATARRQIFNCRMAVSASTRAGLIHKLGSAVVARPPNEPTQTVFVFSGQGGQYIGMGRKLYHEYALFRGHIDECQRILTTAGFPGVLAIILGTAESGLAPLEEFQAFQAAIFALQYGLAALWVSWGLLPTAVVGHSLGEYAAMVSAGVLAVKDALLIVAHRARLMVQKCAIDSTAMIAVNLGPEAVEAALRTCSDFSGLTIACYNSPLDCVLSGALPELKAFKAHLDRDLASKSVLISVPFGYHSAAMAPLLKDLTALAKRVALRAPTIPIISTVLGAVILPGDVSVFTADYFSRHCAEPVQFDRGVRALVSRPEFRKVDAWIEIGPHPTCLPMLKANPALSEETLLLASLRKQQQPSATLTASLAQLYTSNIGLQWRATFAHLPQVTCVSLPSYPFAKTKFWVSFQEPAPTSVLDTTATDPQAQHLITEYTMLRQWSQYPTADNGFVSVFETPIGDLAGWIVGHSVGGVPLCPASVYIEIVLAGVDLSARHLKISYHDSHVVLRRIEFEKPLVYAKNVARTVVTTVALTENEGTFTLSSRTTSKGDEFIHVRGEFKYEATLRSTSKFVQSLPVITRRMDAVAQPRGGNPPEVFSTRTAYEVIFPRVVEYAKPYQTMHSLTVDASGMEGCATIQLPKNYDRSQFVVHPAWIDTLLHVAGFVANLHGGINDAYICVQIGVLKVFPALVNNDKRYLVYCSNAWLPDAGVMLAEAYAVQVAEPRRIVAHIKGMHFRRLLLSSLKKSLAHAAGKSMQVIKSDGLGSPSAPTVIDVNAVVLKLVSDACDISVSSIDVDTDLAYIGIDSMMWIEILGALRCLFPDADLDARILSICATVADICREVVSKAATSPTLTQTVSEEPSSPRTLLDEGDAALLDGAPDITGVLSSVLEVPIGSFDADVDLAALGLDSLTSIEALYAFKTEFRLELPNDFFLAHLSPRAIQTYISGLKSSPVGLVSGVRPRLEGRPLSVDDVVAIACVTKALRLDTVPVPIQSPETSARLPLFFIHDGSGLVNYYERLSFLDRAIWGIHNPRFVSGRAWDSLVDMAAAYVEYILSTTSGPLLLGGWSFGGVAAYEIALQLTSRGIQVKGILLIDSPSPINHIPLSDSLIDTVLDLDVRAERSELSTLVKKQFSMNAHMLGKYVPHATASLCPPLVLLRSSECYRPEGVAIADVPKWLADRSDPQTSVTGWQSLAHCSVKVLDIPGHHFQAFHSSNIPELSLRIADGFLCIVLVFYMSVVRVVRTAA